MNADRTAAAVATVADDVGPRRLGRALWAVVVVATVLDVATTVYALEHLAAVERNPVVRTALAGAGYPGFLTIKLATLTVAAVIYRVVPRIHKPAVPFGFAVPTLAAAFANATLLL